VLVTDKKKTLPYNEICFPQITKPKYFIAETASGQVGIVHKNVWMKRKVTF